MRYDASLTHQSPYLMVRCAPRQHTLRIFQKSIRIPILQNSQILRLSLIQEYSMEKHESFQLNALHFFDQNAW